MDSQLVGIYKFHLIKDQLLIIVMISLGIFLRSSPFISKIYLMPIYLGIGLAMFYSSFLYMKHFILLKTKTTATISS